MIKKKRKGKNDKYSIIVFFINIGSSEYIRIIFFLILQFYLSFYPKVLVLFFGLLYFPFCFWLHDYPHLLNRIYNPKMSLAQQIHHLNIDLLFQHFPVQTNIYYHDNFNKYSSRRSNAQTYSHS